MKIDFYIPTFGRAHKLQAVYDNIIASLSKPESEFTKDIQPLVWFIVEKHDPTSIQAALDVTGTVIINKGKPCYGDAINTAFHMTSAPWFFVGADDISFHYNWLDRLSAHMTEKNGVIGTNDLLGERATHFLVNREYIRTEGGIMDAVNTVYYPYLHNFTDVELFKTAEKRGKYVNVRDSFVEHLHHVNGKAPHDATYAKEEVTTELDRPVFEARMKKFDIDSTL